MIRLAQPHDRLVGLKDNIYFASLMLIIQFKTPEPFLKNK